MKGTLIQRGKDPTKWSLGVMVPDPKTGKSKQHWISFSAKDEDAAEQERWRIIGEIQAGRWRPPDKTKVSEWFDYWLKSIIGPKVKAGDMSAKTLKSYKEIHALHIKPKLGNMLIRAVDGQDLIDLYNEKIEAGLSPSSVNYIHRVIHASLEHARRLKIIDSSPADDVTPPARVLYDAELPNQEMLNSLLNAVQDTVMELPIVIAMATGMRRGEVAGLLWDAVEYNNGLIWVKRASRGVKDGKPDLGPTKTKQTRAIPIMPILENALKAMQKKQEALMEELKDGYQHHNLVVCWEDGRAVDPDYITKQWTKLKKRLGINSHSRFHDLRHNFGSLLAEDGVPIRDIADLMGHADIRTTGNFYLTGTTAAKTKAVKKLEKKLTEKPDNDDNPKVKVLKVRRTAAKK